MSEEGEGVRIKYIYFSSMSEEGESVRGKIKKKKCIRRTKNLYGEMYTHQIYFSIFNQDLIFIHFVVQTKICTEHPHTSITLLYVLL